jgi:hypothetical protein
VNHARRDLCGGAQQRASLPIAAGKPKLEVHPLGIGGKEDPVRLVFDTPPGDAINVSLVDLGNRLRMIVNEVKVVKPQKALPRLPVARAIWECLPDFKTACAAWIYAGARTIQVSVTSLPPNTSRTSPKSPALNLLSSMPKQKSVSSNANCAKTRSTTTSLADGRVANAERE